MINTRGNMIKIQKSKFKKEGKTEREGKLEKRAYS